MKKVLLYSGGMDSWLIDKLWKPDIKLFIDVGTEASKIERERLPEDVIVEEFDLSKYEVKDDHHLLPLRNLFLVELASYYGDVICLGSIGGSVHYDNSFEFTAEATKLLNLLWAEEKREVRVINPWAETSKEDLLREYLKEYPNGLDEAYKESFSCYEPVDGKECGKCVSCLQKREAFRSVGYNC
ncbi:MAG: 7-cyano-7-deazaguanine synthase [Paludibacteraceae bacterium]|nr:7-cyano-7-deazaguanine synthase [Paludibacteraceae bacterium]